MKAVKGYCTQTVISILKVNQDNTTIYLHVAQTTGYNITTEYNFIHAIKLLNLKI